MRMRIWLVGSCAGILLATVVSSFGQDAEVKAPKASKETKVPEASKEAKVPEPVLAGFGTIKLNGLLQGWYQYTDGATPEGTFRLRRAEIKLSGEITPKVSWAIMIDPAQVREDDVVTAPETNLVTSVGRKSVLQDILVSFKLCPSSSIDIGQYKTPFGMEGLTSSAKLDLIERAMLASKLKWADYRDVGVTYKGNFKLGGVKIEPTLGVYNGEGQNKQDANDSKAYAGRLVVMPVESLHLGIAHYNGDAGPDEVANERTGAEFKFTLDPVSIYGEYAIGEKAGKDIETYYGTATCNLGDLYQAVLRYDWLDPDTDADENAVTETTVGLNYFMKKHNAKLALNYVFVGEEGPSVDNDIVRVMAQVSF